MPSISQATVRFGCWALVFVALLWTTHASAEACNEATQGWLDRCAQAGGPPMRVSGCPAGRIVLHLGSDPDTAVDVEVSRSSRGAFRRVGEYSLSPIGEFADWSKEPEARRRMVDQLEACLSRDPTLGTGTGAKPEATVLAPAISRWPWLLVAACSLLVVLSGWSIFRRGWRIGGWGDRRVRAATIGLVGSLAVLVVRWWVAPAWFFHQNGQGPLWIEIALQKMGTSRYGPGYQEIFGWVAHARAAPDLSVFASMAFVSAFVPWWGWVVARKAGASRWAGWVVAAVLAVHPLLVRMAQSESYIAIQLALLWAAAAILMCARRPMTRVSPLRSLVSPSFLLPVTASGSLLAQAVRVHPTAWLPAATIPLILLAQRRGLRERFLQTGVATSVIGAIVAACSGSAVWTVLTGSLGQQWAPAGLVRFPVQPAQVGIAVLAGILLVASAHRRWHAAVPLVLGAGVLGVVFTADMMSSNYQWIADAYRLQFAPVLVAAGIAVLREFAARWPRGSDRATGVGVAVALIGATAYRWVDHTTIPTDARELRWAMRWRDALPAGAQIDYLSRAEERILVLPVYATSSIQASGREAKNLRVLPSTAESLTYYYHSSLCSTPEGRRACDAFERQVEMDVIEERTFPAQTSLPWLTYTRDPIPVGIYRIRPRAASD